MQYKIILKSQDNFLLVWCDMLGQDGDYIVRQLVLFVIVKLVEVGFYFRVYDGIYIDIGKLFRIIIIVVIIKIKCLVFIII